MNNIIVASPVLFIPVSSFFTYQLFSNVARMGANKIAFPFFISMHILVMWRVYTMPIQNKLFTKILTDPTHDGEYIR